MNNNVISGFIHPAFWNDLSAAAANTQFVVGVKSTANKTVGGCTVAPSFTCGRPW